MTETTMTRHDARHADHETHARVTQFLALEARLLDEGRERDWLDLLDDELVYQVPIRAATEPRTEEYSEPGFRIRDTKAHMQTRIDRLNTGIAYSEVPPSRTLRVVGSVEVLTTDRPDLVEANSAILLYRQRGIDPYYDLVPARRRDVIRLAEHGMRLVSRTVYNTETSLETPNLAVIL